MTIITSAHNQKIKFLQQLMGKSRYRKKEGLFTIEGIRELQIAIAGNYKVKALFYCKDIITSATLQSVLNSIGLQAELYEITTEIYQKIAYRGTTEGIIAVLHAKDLSLDSLQIRNPNPLILVAEAPEKPGNIGALLRTADAANLDAVLIADPKTDLYNPNIIRSSIGCVFSNKIAMARTSEIISFLKKNEINMFSAALQASVEYHNVDFKKACAIIVGTEDQGLSEEWLLHSDQNIVIPMGGSIDSMNVSVAAGILIFEAKRQRGFQL